MQHTLSSVPDASYLFFSGYGGGSGEAFPFFFFHTSTGKGSCGLLLLFNNSSFPSTNGML